MARTPYQALELSSVEDMLRPILGDTDPMSLEDFTAEDRADAQDALDAAREWCTMWLKPLAMLPDPLPVSLHRACRIVAVAFASDVFARYGMSSQASDTPAEGVPNPKTQALTLMNPWLRARAGAARIGG